MSYDLTDRQFIFLTVVFVILGICLGVVLMMGVQEWILYSRLCDNIGGKYINTKDGDVFNVQCIFDNDTIVRLTDTKKGRCE